MPCKRMIVDLPPAIQMAIRLRAIKNRKRTGEIVTAAIEAAFPEEMEEARKIVGKMSETGAMSYGVEVGATTRGVEVGE